jgi:glyceraldehyde-3-phosphate dehydrogenase (NADP+)
VCIHVQRIYVQNEIFDKFVAQFKKLTSQLKEGDPTSIDTDISAMIDEENAKRVENWVNEAVNAGAKVLYGGNRKGTFFEPTIMTDTTNEMKVCFLEIFGPVVSIERFSTFEEAIDLLNDSQYGLQAGIFTDNIKEINYAFEHLEVGGVINNDVPTFRVDHMPYGGIKNSGFGREGVKYAIMEMMEPKLLVKEK